MIYLQPPNSTLPSPPNAAYLIRKQIYTLVQHNAASRARKGNVSLPPAGLRRWSADLLLPIRSPLAPLHGHLPERLHDLEHHLEGFRR
ncbi:hypothetical protein PZA11_007584 [Diplocarpon coronariae]